MKLTKKQISQLSQSRKISINLLKLLDDQYYKCLNVLSFKDGDPESFWLFDYICNNISLKELRKGLSKTNTK